MRARGRGAEEQMAEILRRGAGVRRAHLLLSGDLLPELGGLLPDGLHWPPLSPTPRPIGGDTEVRRCGGNGGEPRRDLNPGRWWRQAPAPAFFSSPFSFSFLLGSAVRGSGRSGDARTAEMTGCPERVGSGDGGGRYCVRCCPFTL